MVNNDSELDTRGYAQKHPMRMLGGALMLGTALGASLMSAKKNREKGPLQKFMDQINNH
jgi:hypothetical protein